MRTLRQFGWILSAMVLSAACSSVDNLLETRDAGAGRNSAGTTTITGGTQTGPSGGSETAREAGAGGLADTGTAGKGDSAEEGGVGGSGQGGGGKAGTGGARTGGAPGTGGATERGGASGKGEPDAGNGPTGGNAQQGGSDAGASSACSAATSQAECDARPGCHSVFDNPGNCGCMTSGCCMRFDGCAEGAIVSCTGPNRCPKVEPQCESPYVLSYANGCVEGCVHFSACAP